MFFLRLQHLLKRIQGIGVKKIIVSILKRGYQRVFKVFETITNFYFEELFLVLLFFVNRCRNHLLNIYQQK